MSIYDLITSDDLAAFWNEDTKDRAPYLGETLFPNRKQFDLSLKWIKGRSGVPIVLNPSAFDVHVLPRVREGFETVRAEMPFFKESYYVDEELRRQIIRIQNSNNEVFITTVMRRVFDDTNKLVESAAVTRERQRWMLLTTGVIAFAANGQAFELDYQLDAGQKQTATVPWTNFATSQPIADLQAAIDYQEANTDSTPTRVFMNKYTFNLLRQSESIKNGIYLLNPVFNTSSTVTNDSVMAYVENMLGLTIVVYNKNYRDENGTVTKYIPDGVVTLAPAETLGYTWFAPTPEEVDLMETNVGNVAIVDTGVAITTMVQEDPVKVETKVSQITLPSFEGAEEIVIIDVLAA